MGYYNLAMQWEGDTTQPFTSNLVWKSKRHTFIKRASFNCFLVIANTGDRQDWYEDLLEYRAILKRNASLISNGCEGGMIGEMIPGSEMSINGDNLSDADLSAYSGDFELTVTFIVNGTTLCTLDVYASDVPMRLPGGVRGRSFEYQIEGNVDRIRRFEMASSMEELMQVVEEG